MKIFRILSSLLNRSNFDSKELFDLNSGTKSRKWIRLTLFWKVSPKAVNRKYSLKKLFKEIRNISLPEILSKIYRQWKSTKYIKRELSAGIFSQTYMKVFLTLPDRPRSDVFIVNFEHISHLVLVSLLLTLSR